MHTNAQAAIGPMSRQLDNEPPQFDLHVRHTRIVFQTTYCFELDKVCSLFFECRLIAQVFVKKSLNIKGY